MKITLDLTNCDLQESNVRDIFYDALFEFWAKRQRPEEYVNKNYYDYSPEGKARKIAQVEKRANTARSIGQNAILTVEE